MRRSTKSRDGDIEGLGLGGRRMKCEKRTCERQRKGWGRKIKRRKERERGGGKEGERERKLEPNDGVGPCIGNAVAGRTCRDHGGLMRLRKRRPHGRASAADAFRTRSFAFVRSWTRCVPKLCQTYIERVLPPCITRGFAIAVRIRDARVIPEINLVKSSSVSSCHLLQSNWIRSNLHADITELVLQRWWHFTCGLAARW